MKVLFLILLLSTNIQAQTIAECKAKSGPQTVGTLPVQDQDGLGTCYGNVAALLIQNAYALPKPISYNSIAILHGTLTAPHDRTHIHDKGFSTDEHGTIVGLTDNLIGYGGNTCDAIKFAQQQGFCTAESFPLDTVGGSDVWFRQSTTLTAMADLIDSIATRTNPMTETDWEHYTFQLTRNIFNKQVTCTGTPDEVFQKKLEGLLPANILQKISESQDIIDRVEARMKDPNRSASEQASDAEVIGLNRANLAEATTTRDALLERTPSPANPDVKVWTLRPQILQTLRPRYAQMKTKIESLVPSSGIPGSKQLEALSRQIGNPYDAVVSAATSSGITLPVAARKSSYVDSTDAIISAYRALQDCGSPIDASIPGSVASADLTDSVCLNIGPLSDPKLREANDTAKKLVAFLRENERGGLPERVSSLINFLAPKCGAQMARFGGQTTLSCESLELGPGANTQAKAQDWMIERLCQGRAVGLNICTEFMDAGGPLSTNFCTKRPGIEREHADHAVSVVGYETDAQGKLRYLVQNSWGRTCPFLNPAHATRMGAKCETEGGRPTGRFWINADTLLKNSYQVMGIPLAVNKDNMISSPATPAK